MADRRRPARHRVVFIAWGAVGGRSAEIADALGGEALCLFPPREGARLPAPLRYAAAAAATAWFLGSRRPRAVVVTNPPVFAAVVVWGYALLRRRRPRWAVDSHPGAFGRQGDRVAARLIGVHAFLARRADLCLVTSAEWVEVVEGWGGRGLVIHEAPGLWTVAPARPPGPRPRVLFVNRFASDEPAEEVLGAARALPGVTFQVTGRLADRTPEMVAAAPGNVEFVGFLDPASYRRAVEDADVLISLTTEPTSVMRAAYEAVYAGKVLVISDWPLSRELFPSAVPVRNDAAAIAAGVRHALEHHAELLAASVAARAGQLARWDAQVGALHAALGLDDPGR